MLVLGRVVARSVYIFVFIASVFVVTASAQAPHYELAVGYQSAYLSGGNDWVHDLQVEAVRTLFSDRAGVMARARYQYVPSGVNVATAAQNPPGERGWRRRRTVALDISAVADAVAFTTGSLHHGLRFSFGPSVRYHWGERATSLFVVSPAKPLSELIQDQSYDNLYEARLGETQYGPAGQYVLLTNNLDDASVGLLLGLSYRISYDHFVFALGGRSVFHVTSHDTYGYGFILGYQF